VSVVDPEAEESQRYYLAVFTTQQLAESFMSECGLEGEPRPLHNGREFAWLAQSLRAPISNIAFDPVADAKTVEARWKVSVADLLNEHIVIDYSPWNYPVFVIEQPGGFACVEGQTSDGQEMRAVGFFTVKDKAEEYLKDANESGDIQQLADVDEARAFLEEISPVASAVALNIAVDNGQRSAKYCFSINTILEKYLVERKGRGDDR
jgi:hypothetical protein